MKKFYRIFLAVVVFSLLLSGCKANKSKQNTSNSAAYGGSAYEYQYDYLSDGDMALAEESVSSYSKAVPAAVNDDSGVQNRMIQKSASINIQVMDPIDAAEKIIALTEQSGGFVVSSSSSQEYYNGDISLPRASLTIRVPADRLNETLAFIENLTSDTSKYVSNKRVYGVDITSEYVDTNSRLTSLEKTRDKLYEILDTAQNAEEALEVYSSISQVESDIEVYKGQIKYMEESVSLSSIDVQISSVRPAPIQTVSKWNLGDVFKDAFETLLEGCRSVLEFLVYILVVVLPILVLIAIPVVIILLIVKKASKSRKTMRTAKPDDEQPQDRLADVDKK